MSQIKKDTFKHSHKKYNVFFSNWSVIPNNKRRGYYSSNKKEGVNLLNYMADPHGEVNKDYKFGDFLKLNSPNVFDEKKGHVDNTEVLAPVHKNSIIFTGIISFDFQRSMNEVSKIK
ncbi:hypothetical protein FACS1894166_08380 [Bacilli bacterium]|nr:hypothetical protein FACS1894166_08380 [Bacilli bacterium]